MTITKQTVADKIAAYLHHEITLAQLVDWAEHAMMDGEFAGHDARMLSSVMARLGVADVRAFRPCLGRLRRTASQTRFFFTRGSGRGLMTACLTDKPKAENQP